MPGDENGGVKAARWISIGLVIAGALVGGTLYVASVKGDVNRLEARQEAYEQTVSRSLKRIASKLDDIERHLRPYREP